MTNQPYDHKVGTVVNVEFDGQIYNGVVVDGVYSTTSQKQQFFIEWATDATKYTQAFSRKTGKQFGGSLNSKVRAARVITRIEDDIKCERCGESLDPRRAVWLELSQTDGKYRFGDLPAGHVSQGGFPFGRSCAKFVAADTYLSATTRRAAPAGVFAEPSKTTSDKIIAELEKIPGTEAAKYAAAPPSITSIRDQYSPAEILKIAFEYYFDRQPGEPSVVRCDRATAAFERDLDKIRKVVYERAEDADFRAAVDDVIKAAKELTDAIADRTANKPRSAVDWVSNRADARIQVAESNLKSAANRTGRFSMQSVGRAEGFAELGEYPAFPFGQVLDFSQAFQTSQATQALAALVTEIQDIDETGVGDVALTSEYWDCECHDTAEPWAFIHSKSIARCPICGATRDESPDSRADEVEAMLKAKYANLNQVPFGC